RQGARDGLRLPRGSRRAAVPGLAQPPLHPPAVFPRGCVDKRQIRPVMQASSLPWLLALFFSGARAASRLSPHRTSSEAGLDGRHYVLVAKVKSLDGNKLVLVVEQDLKGKAPFRELHIDMGKGNRTAEKEGHQQLLRKRLPRGLPLVVFCNQRVVEEPEAHTAACVYTNGTWFQVIGAGPTPQAQGWVFIQAEPAARRTFKGPTAELRQIIIEALVGKKAPPPPNWKEPPGFGPEVTGDGSPAEKATPRGR